MSVILPPPNPIRYDGLRQKALRQFHVALANAANAPCDIAVVGDSIGEGALNTTVTDRWITRLLTKLRAKHQPAGVAGGVGYYPAYINISGITPPITASAGAVSSGLTGLGLRSRILDASGDTLELTATATTFRIYFFKTSGLGTWRYSIDGGATTTVNSTAAPLAQGSHVDVATGSAASHTLLIEWVSGTARIDGVMVLNGDESAGIRLWDASSGGAKSNTFLDASANARNWELSLGAIPPDLVLIALGGNDASTQVITPDQMKTNLTSIATNIRSRIVVDYAALAPSIVFIVGYEWPNWTTGGLATPWYPNYRNAIYAAAIEDGNVGVLDLYQRFGLRGDLLGLIPDGVHLTALGSEFYANAVAGYLEP